MPDSDSADSVCFEAQKEKVGKCVTDASVKREGAVNTPDAVTDWCRGMKDKAWVCGNARIIRVKQETGL